MKNYSNSEIKWLVEDYEELKHLKGTNSEGRIMFLIKLADLERSLRRLSKPEFEAVFLCGMFGISTRSAGNLVGTSHVTMNKRYKRGLQSLARYLNAVQR